MSIRIHLLLSWILSRERRGARSFLRYNKKHIRYRVIAYKTVNGEKTYISQALSGFLAAPKSPGRTDSWKLTVSKSKISVVVNNTVKIKAKQTKVNKGKAFLKGGRNVRFVSSCKEIDTVNKKGVVTGVNAGTCKVYAIAANGVTKVIFVTVK